MKVDRRTLIREAVFLLLFRYDFYGPGDMQEQIRDFLDGEDYFTGSEGERIRDKIFNIIDRLPEIDRLLDNYSIGWKVKRMSKVDLTLLRLACYEIRYDQSVPVSTAINDAVEMAKNYGEESSASFINGILAQVAKNG